MGIFFPSFITYVSFVDGIRLDQPYCRSAEECVEEILRDYRREVERLREPPEPALVIKTDPAEELLKE